ncbi:MAG: ROK family protein [Planctomycetes bacterium]|nr:ROK family protein [Planctomycetota bacterium]
MSRRAVGIDLGGTAIKAGAVNPAGDVLARTEVASGVADGAEAVCERIAACARELGATHGLGIGVPGLVDRTRGLVTKSPNLAPMEGYPLRDELARRLGLAPQAVHLENDANVAALGEHWLGGARGERHALVVTLGTGIGGGLILDGALFVGEGGLAAEVGHTTVDPRGPRCGCGNRGCLEALASATAASRRAAAAGLTADLKALTAAARAAAGPERELLHEVGRDLGRGLAQALTLLDLRCYLIGGGFGAAFDVLEPAIREGLLERSYGRAPEELRLRPATLGADAGWIGAARLAIGDASE